jgi:very-short-patch-repair endonuclease
MEQDENTVQTNNPVQEENKSPETLDGIAEKLLDIGKRNVLTNFRDSRTATAEIVFPSPEELFDLVTYNKTFDIFDNFDKVPAISAVEPEPVPEDTLTEEIPEEQPLPKVKTQEEEVQEALNKRDAYIRQYSGYIKNGQVLAYTLGKQDVVLRNIMKKAQSFIEETGINASYLAFGFVHWNEDDSSKIFYRAPVLLVPVRIKQDSRRDPFSIDPTGDDVVVNPSFDYLMNSQYGIRFPEYAQDEKLSVYLEKVSALVERLGWTVTDECKLGIFSFAKMNMHRDIKDNAALVIQNPVVKAMMGWPVQAPTLDPVIPDDLKLKNPVIEMHTVVDADSSQLDAIEMAKFGKSFVLQGPPGTGKSQTITNIIGELLNDGKRILFVSEKMAALDVVFSKLKKVGLEDCCLELYSYKANKKDFIAELIRTLNLKKVSVDERAIDDITDQIKAQEYIDGYERELHKIRGVINRSLYELFGKIASVKDAEPLQFAISDIQDKNEDFLKTAKGYLTEYVSYIGTVGYDYRKNPWYGFSDAETGFEERLKIDRELNEAVPKFEELSDILEEIEASYGISADSMKDVATVRDAMGYLAGTALSSTVLFDEEEFTGNKEKINEIASKAEKTIAARDALLGKYNEQIFDQNGRDLHEKLLKCGGLSRLFGGDFKKISSLLSSCRKTASKISYEEALEDTVRLEEYQINEKELSEKESEIKQLLGDVYRGIYSDWEAIRKEIRILDNVYASGFSFGSLSLMDTNRFRNEKQKFASYRDKLVPITEYLVSPGYRHLAGCFDKTVIDPDTASPETVRDKLKACDDSLDLLDNWMHFRALLRNMQSLGISEYLDFVLDGGLPKEQICGSYEWLFYTQWINYVISSVPELYYFNRISQDRSIEVFKQLDRNKYEINKAVIRQNVSSRRPSPDTIASGTALGMIIREGNKKRKLKSIRTLMDEAGDAIQKIKPCFLMSPLSVSTFLNPEKIHFDTVIFDEASQIFPWDALGSIYRGDQLIVVGDTKQMPPTNFFQASIAEENLDEEDMGDFESVLDLCASTLPQKRLLFHYRSKDESLITFSNRAFYDGTLITFPCSDPKAKDYGITYHHVDGIFDRKTRTNMEEARYITNLVFEDLQKHPERSIGVVAFSISQQELIDDLIQRERDNHPELDKYFSQALKEPIFIKNLETVQGDERDTIILSVAYGMGSDGRLIYNFGPLNKEGGERRLNVAVSRSKTNVQVVSSMHALDIDLSRTSTRGSELIRAYLDYAEHGVRALDGMVSLSAATRGFDSGFERDVYDFLTMNGYSVDPQVGCSGFRIDLGVKVPDTSKYVLAIECDGASYHSFRNARDRDCSRQSLLEGMGWQFYRIWSTDWYRNNLVEKENLIKAVEKALHGDSGPSDSSSQPKPEEPKKEEPLSYENEVEVKPMFEQYVLCDDKKLYYDCGGDPRQTIRRIIAMESPVSIEWLTKRSCFMFGADKVNAQVRNSVRRCLLSLTGIYIGSSFVYDGAQSVCNFRSCEKGVRDLKYVAPEEIAEGIRTVLRFNGNVPRLDVYKLLAKQSGNSRMSQVVISRMDEVLSDMGDVGCADDVLFLKER